MKRSNIVKAAVLGILAGCSGHAAASGGYFPLPCMIPNAAVYTGGGINYANGWGVSDIRLSNFGGCTPLPPVGGSIITNGPCNVELRMGIAGGPIGTPTAGGVYTARITRTGVTTFDTEMLQLDILGGTLPPGVGLRESPVLPSFGQMTAVPIGGGYQIDSFFDIFTELTLNGGATWVPSVGSARIVLSGPCYANCDGSVGIPALSVNDFVCYLNRFAAGDPYANCDGSTNTPVLNVLDFACFLNKVSQGCN